MDHFAGLDVSVKETSVCIVNDTGRIVREVKVASEPEALLVVLKNPAYHFERIGLEAGPLSQWLFSALAAVTSGLCRDAAHAGGAAALETGVPQFMMSMLIRAGLPSRRAAMAAVRSSDAIFTTPAEMREWLGSNDIAALTDQGDWPTADTTALWKRFRTEALSGAVQK